MVETVLIVDFLGEYLGYKDKTKVWLKCLIFFLRKLSRDNAQKTEMAMLQLQVSEQKERMKEIDIMYNEILQIRHDIRKCINCAAVKKQKNMQKLRNIWANCLRKNLGL